MSGPVRSKSLRPAIVRLMVRLYPKSWRARYGDEFVAMLDDLAADGRSRWRLVIDAVRGALDAHANMLGDDGVHRDLLRAALTRMACGFVMFGAGGVAFAKASEDVDTSSHDAIRVALGVVRGAGGLAVLTVLVAVIPAVGAAIRLIRRARRWRPFLILGVPILSTLMTVAGVTIVAHRAARTSAVAVTVTERAVIAGIAVGAFAVWAVAARSFLRRPDSEIPEAALRGATVPTVLSLAMAATTLGTVVWAVAVRQSNPSRFRSLDGLLGAPLPATLAAAVTCMTVGTIMTSTAAGRSRHLSSSAR